MSHTTLLLPSFIMVIINVKSSNNVRFVTFVGFRYLNISTVANFRLPTGSH